MRRAAGSHSPRARRPWRGPAPGAPRHRRPAPSRDRVTAMADGRTFALVRHGGTDYNAARRLNGDPSVPVHLTDDGGAQVAAAARADRRHADRPRASGRASRAPSRPSTSCSRAAMCRSSSAPSLDDVLPRRVRGAVGRRLPALPRRERPGRPPARRREPPRRAGAATRAASSGCWRPTPRTAGGDPRHPHPLPRQRHRRRGPPRGPRARRGERVAHDRGEEEMRRGVAAMKERLAPCDGPARPASAA